MKKIIFILALFVSFVANAQYTPPTGYTNINSRYDWLAGVFRALGLPAGGNAAFTTGQAQRAGAVYYDSTGVDSGLHVWTGVYWRNYATSSYTDADARAAISLTTTGTSGAATYSSATGVFNIPVYAGTLNANVGAFYRWLKPATQEIKTFANGYGLLIDSITNTDALTAILDSATVFPQLRATIPYPNLRVERAGAGIPTWYLRTSDTTLMLKDIIGETFISVGTKTDSTNYVRLDTANTDLKAYIAANSGGGGSGWSLTGNAGTTAGTNFVGTTDAVALQLKTNGVQRIVLGSTGNIGYGITSAATIEHTFSATRTTGTLALYEFQGHKDAANGATTQFSRLLSTKQNLVGFGLAGGAVSSGMVGNLANDTEGIYILSGSSGAAKIAVKNAGVYVGTGITAPTPTARLHIQAGTATAGTAPLKFTSGPLLTTAEAGAKEFLTDKYYGTITTGAARKEFTLNDIALTSGRIPFTTTDGRLTDVSTVLWDGTTATFPLLKMTGGSPGAGKVLTSDADGDATWTSKATLTRHMNLPTPSASEDEFIFSTPVAITITDVRVVLVGSSTPSVTYNIAFDADRSAAGTNVYTAGQTVTSTTTMTAASGVNDNTLPANSIIRLKTSAQSGTVTSLNLSITYTED